MGSSLPACQSHQRYISVTEHTGLTHSCRVQGGPDALSPSVRKDAESLVALQHSNFPNLPLSFSPRGLLSPTPWG